MISFPHAMALCLAATSLPLPAPAPVPAPATGSCRMSVWLTGENPTTYDCKCEGDCEHQDDTCEKKNQLIDGTRYYYCKCVHEGTPVEPDSTACTTVVTHGEPNGPWGYYCYDQFCESTCYTLFVTWNPSTPCVCH